jgi:hypothetical protein
MIKCIFHTDDIKPQHIFYDNNCTLSKMVKDNPYFKNIGLSVDVIQSLWPIQMNLHILSMSSYGKGMVVVFFCKTGIKEHYLSQLVSIREAGETILRMRGYVDNTMEGNKTQLIDNLTCYILIMKLVAMVYFFCDQLKCFD